MELWYSKQTITRLISRRRWSRTGKGETLFLIEMYLRNYFFKAKNELERKLMEEIMRLLIIPELRRKSKQHLFQPYDVIKYLEMRDFTVVVNCKGIGTQGIKF
jgi:hypothetical protein